jgi:hypothetical protein
MKSTILACARGIFLSLSPLSLLDTQRIFSLRDLRRLKVSSPSSPVGAQVVPDPPFSRGEDEGRMPVYPPRSSPRGHRSSLPIPIDASDGPYYDGRVPVRLRLGVRMGVSSSSARAREDFRNAEAQTARRAYDGLTFASVERCLAWFFPMREKMQSPKGMHPRGEEHLGELVILDIEGGRGGDMDEVLATLSTVGAALEQLRQDIPRAWEVVVARLRDGKTFRDLEKIHGVSCSSLSADEGKGQAYLLGQLRAAGVVR